MTFEAVMNLVNCSGVALLHSSFSSFLLNFIIVFEGKWMKVIVSEYMVLLLRPIWDTSRWTLSRLTTLKMDFDQPYYYSILGWEMCGPVVGFERFRNNISLIINIFQLIQLPLGLLFEPLTSRITTSIKRSKWRQSYLNH